MTEDTVCGVLGLAGSRKTAQLLHAIADGDAAGLLTEFADLYAAGKDLSALLSELSTLARDLLVLRTAPQNGKNMLSGLSSAEDREALLKKLSPAQLLRIVTVGFAELFVRRTTEKRERFGLNRFVLSFCL